MRGDHDQPLARRHETVVVKLIKRSNSATGSSLAI
jgi:hypothetical protein